MKDDKPTVFVQSIPEAVAMVLSALACTAYRRGKYGVNVPPPEPEATRKTMRLLEGSVIEAEKHIGLALAAICTGSVDATIKDLCRRGLVDENDLSDEGMSTLIDRVVERVSGGVQIGTIADDTETV